MRIHLLALPLLLSLAACVTEATGSGPTERPVTPAATGTTDENDLTEDTADGGAATDAAPAVASTAAVTIDDLEVTVSSIELWQPAPGASPEYKLFLRLAGSSTDLAISATYASDVCGPAPYNNLVYRTSTTQFGLPFAQDDAGTPLARPCTFVVTAIPDRVGDHFRGSFVGFLDELNGNDARYVTVRFDVVREK